MKKIFFLLLLLGYSYLVQAQTDNVYISVAMPSDGPLTGIQNQFLKTNFYKFFLRKVSQVLNVVLSL